jgi:hypothetical protein
MHLRGDCFFNLFLIFAGGGGFLIKTVKFDESANRTG